jgi:hypothetical protein
MPRTPQAAAELMAGPFTIADAARSGVTSRMLQGKQWRPVTRGVYCHRDVLVNDEIRLAAVRLALPKDAVATGRLAAWLHGAWTPAEGRPMPMEWALERGRARPRQTLDGSHRLVVPACDVETVHGIAVTSAMRTAFQLMRRAPLAEAVVVADAFAWAGAVQLPWLWAYVDAHRRWPGVARARTALDLASHSARSPGETRIRMVAVLGGLPEPFVNVPVMFGATLLAVVDLYLVGRRPAGVEYDGAYHETSEQHRADNRRENVVSAQTGLPLLRYDRYTVARPAERDRALWEMGRAIGVEPRNQLDHRWFTDPRRPFRW